MTGYGQFCPVAKTMEFLDERWTVLIIRELLSGSWHFNEIRRGLPRMSPTLLSKRLRTLTRSGLIVRVDVDGRIIYDLTPEGRDLEPIIVAIGDWGLRWRTRLNDDDLDPHVLIWDIRRGLDHDALPPRSTTVAFRLHGVDRQNREWWLIASDGVVDVCDIDPGHDPAVVVDAPLVSLVRVWRGDVSWRQMVDRGDVVLFGEPAACQALPRWLGLPADGTAPRDMYARSWHVVERACGGVTSPPPSSLCAGPATSVAGKDPVVRPTEPLTRSPSAADARGT